MSHEIDPESHAENGGPLNSAGTDGKDGNMMVNPNKRPSIVAEAGEEYEHDDEKQSGGGDAQQRRNSGADSRPAPLVVTEVDTEAIEREIAEAESMYSGGSGARSSVSHRQSVPTSPISPALSGSHEPSRRASLEDGVNTRAIRRGSAEEITQKNNVQSMRRTSMAATPTLRRNASESNGRPRRATFDETLTGTASARNSGKSSPNVRRSSALAVVTSHTDSADSAPMSPHTPVVGIAEVGRFQVRDVCS